MTKNDIAVIGFACRFPGAPEPAAFWRLLREGREARVELADDDLRAAGVPEELLQDPAYVKAAMLLADVDQWDAGFFGMSPRDAAIMDPQHRVFLEVAWEALEHGGHVPEDVDRRVGVFAGCGMDTYLLHNILTNPELVRTVGMFLIRHTGNDKDFLATRVSYQFDLQGPSVNVLTACSTSLVAVHQACQSLLLGECDLALAGGVTILVPQDRGYLHQEGEILSPDGCCRPFDAAAAGTVFGSGAGVVLLRRLADAERDGDTIHAVIAGSAVNNDGARKVGFFAPSVDGHAEVVAEALAMAGVSADAVQYVEAHGTGTALGDPIEIEALTQAFRTTTQRNGYCGIGSVKSNIGHLDAAAGVASLLKVVLALRAGELPASLHFRQPNPRIGFDASPFRVVAASQPWCGGNGGAPRIAGVSSLGVGGTNCHVVVREAPAPALAPPPHPRRWHLLPVSARGPAAVAAACVQLAGCLEQQPGELADVAFTLQAGRRAFVQRTWAVATDAAGAAAALRAPECAAAVRTAPAHAPAMVFLFPGGGVQHPGMGRDLYRHEPAYRAAADACLELLPPATAERLRRLLLADAPGADAAAELERPSLALPALFLTEYSLARTLLGWGIEPDAMIGHSLGEYVAACLAGVFTLEQAMRVVLLRAELFEQAAAGAMLSVPMPADEVAALQDGELSVAASNGPALCAVAGTVGAIARLERTLQDRAVECQRVHIQVAAHSHLLDPLLERFRDGLRGLELRAPRRRFVSNVTGDWIEPERARSPDYWVDHLRRTVRFHEGVATILGASREHAWVELGPGRTLTSLVRMHGAAVGAALVQALPHPKEAVPADRAAVQALGQLWQAGVAVDWTAFQGGPRRRVPLPTYPFQRQRHWIEPGGRSATADRAAPAAPSQPPRRLPEARWFQRVEFQRRPHAGENGRVGGSWLVVGKGHGLGAAVVERLLRGGAAVHQVVAGSQWSDLGQGCWLLPLSDAAAWQQLLRELASVDALPDTVLDLTPLDGGTPEQLICGLLARQQAMGRAGCAESTCTLLVTSGAVAVDGEGILQPAHAAAAAWGRVVPREYPGARWSNVDLDAAALRDAAAAAAVLLQEAGAGDAAALHVAWRGGQRRAAQLAALSADEPAPAAPPLPEGGVFLIAGGLGGLGLALAEHLAARCGARLVLVSRRGLPSPELWPRWRALRPGDRTAATMARLQALVDAGHAVEVVEADIASATGARAAVGAALRRFGQLDGVFHLAGVLDDGPIQNRTEAQVAAVLRPKVAGAEALAAALDQAGRGDVPLVLFASISGLVGIPGQSDYAAANAFLDAFARQRRSAGCPTLAVDWGVFGDAGMAVAEQALSLGDPAALAEDPVLGRAGPAPPAGIEFRTRWDPRQRWALHEHRLRDGTAVMPGMAFLELAVLAVRRACGPGPVELRDVELLAPLLFPADAARDVCVVLAPERGGVAVTVQSAAEDDQAAQRTTHARMVAVVPAADAGELLDVAGLRAALATGRQIPAGRQQEFMAFGPRWQCVRAAAADDDGVVTELALAPEFAEDLAEHPLHPALLDMAFGCAVPLLDQGGAARLFAPVACEAVAVPGRLVESVFGVVRWRGGRPTDHLAVLDVQLCDPDGIPLLSLHGLQVYGLLGGLSAAALPPAPPRRRTPVPPRPEPRIRALLPQGMRAGEGMAALERALASGEPQVVVSATDVARTAAWLSLPPVGVEAESTAAGDAPAAGAASAGPRDEVERLLAAAFGELLGVVGVGIDQDFFELGGHSLLAVRLFARIHRELGLDLEIATLLTSPTVRRLATELRRQLGRGEPAESTESAAADTLAAAPRVERGAHLVPIQTAGPRPNLFLAHGAGGNVLGFRDLSFYLGADQPLYGLQARGVDGKTRPHESIAEMATAYLAEIRAVQPDGPYYLGGYSGGGCIAYEMAQQLRAAGERVAFVGMIDTPSPHMRERGPLARGGVHLARLLRRGPAYPFRLLRMKLDQYRARREHQQRRARGEALPQDLRGWEMQYCFDRAFFAYRVTEYDGEVVLFRAADEGRARFVRDRELGWGGFPRLGVRVIDCPGDHHSMCTEPNVEVLCRRMREELDRARARAG